MVIGVPIDHGPAASILCLNQPALAVEGHALAHPGAFENWLSAAAWILMIPAVASFVAMNFTGASTYTSLSGVRREMRVALPVQIACAVVGAGM